MSRPEPAGIISDFGGVLWNRRWDVSRDLESTYGLPDGVIGRTLYASDAVDRGDDLRAQFAAMGIRPRRSLVER